MSEQKINSFLQLVSTVPGLAFDGDRYTMDEAHKTKADEIKIAYEEFGSTLQLKCKHYFPDENVKYYEALESEIKSGEIFSSLLLISSCGSIVKFDPIHDSFAEFGKPNKVLLKKFKNIISYFRLFNFLKSENFCDYFNDANAEIIIYSSINGIIKIKYDPIPVIPAEEDNTNRVKSLINIATPINISPFFKNSLFTASKGTGKLAFSEIINQAEDIIAITKRDYELVSKQFDFEKFRDSLYKEKEKYFTSIREIVNKIFGQAVGIPISISATVFATYKVADDIFMLALVLVAFCLYVIFYIKIQCIYNSDLLEIENDFEESFEIISSKSGLGPEIIKAEKQKVVRKISSTKVITFWLIVLVGILGFLVVGYIIYQIIYNETLALMKILFDPF